MSHGCRQTVAGRGGERDRSENLEPNFQTAPARCREVPWHCWGVAGAPPSRPCKRQRFGGGGAWLPLCHPCLWGVPLCTRRHPWVLHAGRGRAPTARAGVPAWGRLPSLLLFVRSVPSSASAAESPSSSLLACPPPRTPSPGGTLRRVTVLRQVDESVQDPGPGNAAGGHGQGRRGWPWPHGGPRRVLAAPRSPAPRSLAAEGGVGAPVRRLPSRGALWDRAASFHSAALFGFKN